MKMFLFCTVTGIYHFFPDPQQADLIRPSPFYWWKCTLKAILVLATIVYHGLFHTISYMYIYIFYEIVGEHSLIIDNGINYYSSLSTSKLYKTWSLEMS